jgi:hypothetical protein
VLVYPIPHLWVGWRARKAERARLLCLRLLWRDEWCLHRPTLPIRRSPSFAAASSDDPRRPNKAGRCLLASVTAWNGPRFHLRRWDPHSQHQREGSAGAFCQLRDQGSFLGRRGALPVALPASRKTERREEKRHETGSRERRRGR